MRAAHTGGCCTELPATSGLGDSCVLFIHTEGGIGVCIEIFVFSLLGKDVVCLTCIRVS